MVAYDLRPASRIAVGCGQGEEYEECEEREGTEGDASEGELGCEERGAARETVVAMARGPRWRVVAERAARASEREAGRESGSMARRVMGAGL